MNWWGRGNPAEAYVLRGGKMLWEENSGGNQGPGMGELDCLPLFGRDRRAMLKTSL